MFRFLFLTFVGLFLNSRSYAQSCGYSFTVSNFVSQIDTSEQSISHSLSVSRRSGSKSCRNVRIYFDKGGSNSYSRQAYSARKSVPYNIYRESSLNNVLKDYPDGSSNEYISLNLQNRYTTYSENFFFKVIDLDSVFSNGPGYYNDLIEMKLYTVQRNGSLRYESSAYMNVQISIPRYAELSLGSVGSSHDPTQTEHIMSFGNLQEGKIANAVLNVKSTVSFGVYMSSMNGSSLNNGSSEIPYQININNSGYRNLSNAGQNYYITQRNLSSPVNYEVFPIEAKIGVMPSNPQTGEYSDVITVTVTPW